MDNWNAHKGQSQQDRNLPLPSSATPTTTMKLNRVENSRKSTGNLHKSYSTPSVSVMPTHLENDEFSGHSQSRQTTSNYNHSQYNSTGIGIGQQTSRLSQPHPSKSFRLL